MPLARTAETGTEDLCARPTPSGQSSVPACSSSVHEHIISVSSQVSGQRAQREDDNEDNNEVSENTGEFAKTLDWASCLYEDSDFDPETIDKGLFRRYILVLTLHNGRMGEVDGDFDQKWSFDTIASLFEMDSKDLWAVETLAWWYKQVFVLKPYTNVTNSDGSSSKRALRAA
ncbi:hypothetical protein PILCRDRAFT_2160 [Piloderma croceum F 1598]|uniref:Uncharacterized protein n=1 Tax=Piloderma croceum (strain F 1598) TaxID=765440 RepID=A0A0C3CJH1_PILCF|nr:hypothetical protein PILCRDRAFT_2160 [Piloderma croceum F 1598]